MKNKLKFGYMPSFNSDLFEEIKFAKNYFDFIEITPALNNKWNDKKWLIELNKTLNSFQLLGHVHWDIDLSKNNNIPYAIKQINILYFLGAKKITIHPSISKTKNYLTRNHHALKKIIKNIKTKNIHLLIENNDSLPFNHYKNIYNLINDLPVDFTLDIGHAISNNELNSLININKIKHIHFHFAKNHIDHIPIFKKNTIKNLINKINNTNAKTMTLEIFRNLDGYKIDGNIRKNIILKQLDLIKNEM